MFGRKLGPYELNSIIEGDCLEVMPGLPDKSVDLLLSDWPYGITACDWDSVIPLGPLWKECKRVIKPGGAIVLTAAQPFTSVLVMSNLDWWGYEIIWEKNTGTRFLDSARRPLNFHESILVFYQSQPTYNPQKWKGEPNHSQKKRGQKKINIYRGGLQWVEQGESGWKYPRSVVYFETVPPAWILHPTQKPVALFSYLIRTYSNPGDLVLDNAAGSCTTAIAAIETGRNWLCIEQLPKYVKIGRERVRERLLQPFIPGLVEVDKKPEQLELREE
jgi:site-specific DNA-methyltransferase (adenine-specific)